MRDLTIGLVAALLLLGACSSGGDDDSSTPEDAPTETTEPAVEVDPRYEALIGALGSIELTTDESGGGDRPVLSWEPVADAANYRVVVLDADGQPYWGWTTTETELVVGAVERPEGAPGPRIAEGMSWSVIADDADGIPIAVSARQPIAP